MFESDQILELPKAIGTVVYTLESSETWDRNSHATQSYYLCVIIPAPGWSFYIFNTTPKYAGNTFINIQQEQYILRRKLGIAGELPRRDPFELPWEQIE